MNEPTQESVHAIPNMTNDETEYFILALQNYVYQLRENWLSKVEVANEAQGFADREKGQAEHVEDKLRAVAAFLNIYNSGAREDWFAELDLEEEPKSIPDMNRITNIAEAGQRLANYVGKMGTTEEELAHMLKLANEVETE